MAEAGAGGGEGKTLSLLLTPCPASYLSQFVQFHVCFQFPEADV